MLPSGHSPIVDARSRSLVAAAVAGAAHGDVRRGRRRGRPKSRSSASARPAGRDGTVSLQAVDQVRSDIGRALAASLRRMPWSCARPYPRVRPRSGRSRSCERDPAAASARARTTTAIRTSCAKALGSGLQGPAVHPDRRRAGDDAAVLRELYAEVAAPIHVVPYRIAESVKHLGNALSRGEDRLRQRGRRRLAADGIEARRSSTFCDDRLLNISSAYLSPASPSAAPACPRIVRSFLALAERQAPRRAGIRCCPPTTPSRAGHRRGRRATAGSRSACSASPSSRAPTTCANRPS